MNKNIIFTNDLKKDSTNKIFLEFIEDFYEKKTKENKYKSNKQTFITYTVGLSMVECLVYNSHIFHNDLKALNMIGIACVGLVASSQKIVNMVSMNLQRKQRKTELVVIDEKTNHWLVSMQDKEKRFEVARFFIEEIDKIRLVKNTTTLEQPLKEFTERIYGLFSKELKEEDFYIIFENIQELEDLQNQANKLEREEDFLSELKDEMNLNKEKESEPSKSFTKVKKTVSFK